MGYTEQRHTAHTKCVQYTETRQAGEWPVVRNDKLCNGCRSKEEDVWWCVILAGIFIFIFVCVIVALCANANNTQQCGCSYANGVYTCT
jgi:hypothetical protein